MGTQGSPLLSINLTKDRQLVVLDEEAMGKVQTVPKPRFLNTLETFMKRELRTLGVSEEPSDLRLQVFREAFDLLIADFKTYQPILSSVKNEYEKMISCQREQIRKMQPLKQMLVTVSEECDKKVMEIREQEKQEIYDLRTENKAQCLKIDCLQRALLQQELQVERLHEELRTDHHRLRDEIDARKLLVVKLNDYKMQQDDLAMAAQSYLQELEDEKNDPVLLKYALKGARNREKDLTAQIEKLELEIASYVSVVPSKDYEQLRQKNRELDRLSKNTQAEAEKAKQNYDTLYSKYTDIREEKEQLQEEFDKLKTKSLTPRPDWDKCADHIPGGLMRWKQLARGKHSEELVAVLLRELTKVQTDGSTAGIQSIDNQGDEGVVLTACQLAIFLTQHNIETTKDGIMKKTDFRMALEGFSPNKDSESINSLMKCAEFQLDAKAYTDLEYTKLFWEDEEGKLGDFLEELSSQYYRERREYVQEIWEELANTDPVSPEDLKRAISIIDPEITPEDMDKYLLFAYSVNSVAKLKDIDGIPLSSLVSRLQKGMIRRIGKSAS